MRELAWCVGFLLLLRLALALVPAVSVRADINSAAAFLRRAHREDLRVVFFGSSRMNSAILPKQWARRSGLEPNQVVNLAVNGGSLWDALYMVRSAGGLPPSVELVVIEIADWEFNRNWRYPDGSPHGVDEEVRVWATLSDRLAVDDLGSRLGLLADLVWPLSRRQSLEQWLERPWDALPVAPPGPVHFTDRQAEANLANAVPFQAENIAGKHFADAEISSFTRRNLKELLSAIDTVPGREIVLLELPARRAYLRTLHDDPRGKAFSEQVRRIIDSYASDHVHVLVWETPQDCGLEDDIFVDYGHLSSLGARQFTSRLFLELVKKKTRRGGTC